MSGEAGNGTDEAVGILAHMLQVRRYKVANFQILPDAHGIPSINISGVVVHEQKKVNMLHHLAVREPDFGQSGELVTQFVHILLGQKQGVVSLVQLDRHFTHMDGRPHTLGRAQSNVQGILETNDMLYEHEQSILGNA